MSDVIVPSSPNDRQKLLMAITEMTHCLQRIEDERESMKEIADDLVSKFEIPKKQINKLAKTMYKRDYENVQQENEDFELLYETIVASKTKEIAA